MDTKVYLVGAGPGDPGLISLRAKELLERADSIVYDYLANPKFLSYAKDGARLIYVGKKVGHHSFKQEQINQIILDEAKKGRMVVRLKGGDPFVFGRGGEEYLFLKEHGIKAEVVPGISSALGGLTYGGIPPTQRDYSRSVHIFTGYFASGAPDYPWESIAKIDGTLVFLMGLTHIGKIQKGLLQAGMDENMPAAIIRKATTPQQKVYNTTLKALEKTKVDNEISSPALIVIGRVCDLSKEMNFFSQRPLNGKKIGIFRRREDLGQIYRKLSDLGAWVYAEPLIGYEILKADMSSLPRADLIIFTSYLAVKGFFKNLKDKGLDSRSLAGKKVYSIGPRTSKELEAYNILPDYESSSNFSKGMEEELRSLVREDELAFYPCSNLTDNALSNTNSFRIIQEPVYKTVKLKKDLSILDEGGWDLVFFSPSQVHAYKSSKGKFEGNNIISIGPKTSEALRDLGIGNFEELESHYSQGLYDYYRL